MPEEEYEAGQRRGLHAPQQHQQGDGAPAQAEEPPLVSAHHAVIVFGTRWRDLGVGAGDRGFVLAPQEPHGGGCLGELVPGEHGNRALLRHFPVGERGPGEHAGGGDDGQAQLLEVARSRNRPDGVGGGKITPST